MILSHRTVRFSKPPRAIQLARNPREEELARQRAQVDAAREEGRRQGREEAMQILNAQILEQRAQIAHLQENTFRAVIQTHAELCEQLRNAVPVLAMEVVRRILGGIEMNHDIVRAVAAETLQELAPGTPEVELRLCPPDLELVAGLEKEFQHVYPGLSLVADTDLRPGDCVARSHFGTIDARIERKIENIEAALR